jgi:hypothetical protein
MKKMGKQKFEPETPSAPSDDHGEDDDDEDDEEDVEDGPELPWPEFEPPIEPILDFSPPSDDPGHQVSDFKTLHFGSS